MGLMDVFGRFSAGTDDIDWRVRSVDILEVQGVTYLISSFYNLGSAKAYRVQDASEPTEITTTAAPFKVSGTISVLFDGSQKMIPLDQLTWATNAFVSGQSMVSRTITAGANDFSGGAMEVLAVPEAGGARLYIGAQGVSGLTSYFMTTAGTVTSRVTFVPDGQNYTSDIGRMTGFAFEGQDYLAVASSEQRGVSLFKRLADGALEHSDSIGSLEGIGMSTPTQILPFEIESRMFLVVAGFEGTLSTLQVAPEGSLSLVDHVLDGRETRFGMVTSMASFSCNDQYFILAGGGDQGVSLLQLLPNGTLLHRESLADSVTTMLDNITDIAVASVGTSLYAFVTSDSENGVTQLKIDTAALGSYAAAIDGTPLIGTQDGDVLMGGDKSDRIEGGNGDDILLDGAGNDILIGGAGADTFILDHDGQTDRIEGFNYLEDRLDLSHWKRLYSIDSVTVKSLTGGARIIFGDETLDIYSSLGQVLTAAQLGQSLTTALQRPVTNLIDPDLPVPPLTLTAGNSGSLLEASTVSLALYGGTGFDTADYRLATIGVIANLGNPALNTGAAKGDTYTGIEGIRGTAFNDDLSGDIGANLLVGDEGNDRLNGGAGADTLEGGPGNDWLFDPLGATKFIGGSGNDTAIGLHGRSIFEESEAPDATSDPNLNDIFAGGYGDDDLNGGAGSDYLIGDYGAQYFYGKDRLVGGKGDDFLEGDFGADVFVFRTEEGHDTIARFSQGAVTNRPTGGFTPISADFEPGIDKIRLEGFADITSGATALAMMYENSAGHAELSLDGTVITLWGIGVSSLSADDFLV